MKNPKTTAQWASIPLPRGFHGRIKAKAPKRLKPALLTVSANKLLTDKGIKEESDRRSILKDIRAMLLASPGLRTKQAITSYLGSN